VDHPILRAQVRRLAVKQVAAAWADRSAGPSDGKTTGDSTEWTGLFIPLPRHLADQFPKKQSGNDKSPPHITLLYVGNVKGREAEFVSTCQRVVSEELREPVTANLEGLDYFTHPAEERRVAILPIRFSHRMAELRDRLKSAVQDLGIEVGDSYTVYRPHTTLDYLDGLEAEFGGVTPTGSWTFDEIEIWGMPKTHKLKAGSAKVAREALRYVWKGPAQADADWKEISKELVAFSKIHARFKGLSRVPEGKLREKLQEDGFPHALSQPGAHPLHFGRPFGGWVLRSLGRDAIDYSIRRRVRDAAGDLFKSVKFHTSLVVGEGVTLTYRVQVLLTALDSYADQLNSFARQAGVRRFKYQGFSVQNPDRLPEPTIRKFLSGVDYVVGLFKQRGVTPLLHETVHTIIIRHSSEGETAHGWYGDRGRIQLLTAAAGRVDGRMLREWIHEIFLHEVGHHFHLTLMHPEARKEWDSGWIPVQEAEKVDAQTEKDIRGVSLPERMRFWGLLEESEGNLRGIRLRGLDRMKFHAWLHEPLAGGPFVTPKQLRWNRDRGVRMHRLLSDPVRLLSEDYGTSPGESDYQRRMDRVFRQVKSTLGATGVESFTHPTLTKEQVAAYAQDDSAVAQALEALQVPTEYAKTNEREDFAESFVAFMAAPGRLSEMGKFRMQRALSLSGLYGKPLMRLSRDEKVAAARVAKSFTLNLGDPVLTGKYLNSKGYIVDFKKGPKGDPMVVVETEPDKDGKTKKKDVRLFKLRFDEGRARKKAAARVASQYLTRVANIDLKQEGLEGLVSGAGTILYHGTTRSFRAFDMAQSRDDLVSKFYGKGIFLTPSKRVAVRYADANRNIGFPVSIIAELARLNKGGGSLLQSMFDLGHGKGWDHWMATNNLTTGEDIDALMGDMDPNDLNDIAGYILGSKVEPPPAGGSLFSQGTGLPEYVYDSLDTLGLDSAKYRPKVYTVMVKAQNVLVTARKEQARKARKNGYDCVVFHGSGLVDGVPEVALFDPRKVKILKVEPV
jgi:2'-5' RNA ligase